MKNVKDDNICKVHFDVDPRPAQEAEETAKRHAVIIRQINAAALRYSRGFIDEEQRKYFMRGVAFALRPTLHAVEKSKRPGWGPGLDPSLNPPKQ